jgi:hypothetical protein
MTSTPKGCVDGCQKSAVVEVILYDIYPAEGHVFFEPDFTCQFLCASHMVENEERAKGTRQPRGYVQYPFTNKYLAAGFTIYFPLERKSREIIKRIFAAAGSPTPN